MSIEANTIAAVILAGGQARRMGGGDKALLPLCGKPMLDYLIERLKPQTDIIAINANSPAQKFNQFGLPVIADEIKGFLGPLAGILAGLDWMVRHYPARTHLVSLAADTPFIPRDLVKRLGNEVREGDEIVRGASNGRAHPVCALWPVAVRGALRDQLVNKEIRKIEAFTNSFTVRDVEFHGIPDPFFNVNTPEDVSEAERVLKTCIEEKDG